ncbi:Protein kinase, ATP binding site [Phytophthora cactorum]|nr:Protein kinase, ATP binding site [Phytophthora cactorum]
MACTLGLWISAAMPSLGVDALVQQTQVIARCLGWANNTCAFSPVEPVHFSGLDLAQQTVCKADLSVAVKQIDWESPAGGRGSVDSLLVNGVEMLQAPVHPSQSYMIANYPHCNDMFNIFPPWGNGIIGPEGRKSIIPQITTADLPISIHFSWKGPHEVNPVCSMVGVSIAGYVEINIYLEAQDNSGRLFWGDCKPCPRDCGHGTCSSGLNGTGECLCHEGWRLEGKMPCTTCADGYIGPTCQLCPGFLESEVACSGHGQCVMSGTEAVCHCDARYGGDGCESYDFPFLMVAILGTIALSTLGFCMCTMRRLARQPHTLHGPFLNRGNSFSQSEYVEISDMADLEYFVSNDSRDWLIPFDSLSLQCEVGNGTSGQVFRSLLHSGGGSSVVAVKRLYSPVTGQEYFQSFFRREVSILSRLHHPYVVRFYGVSYYNRVLYIVTDFCPNSLSGLIENPAAKGPLEEAVFMKVINQIVSGMGFLHSRNVVHRDLKPANVLISETDDVNICDFGLSRLIEPDATTMTAEVGTPSYMAPEMATMGGIQCSTKGDVYSFGILLYSTWSRSKPYGDQGMNPFQLLSASTGALDAVMLASKPGSAPVVSGDQPDPKGPVVVVHVHRGGRVLLPESPGRVQLMSASSSVSTIPTGATGHGRGSKENVNAMSPFASPRHDGDGYGPTRKQKKKQNLEKTTGFWMKKSGHDRFL